MANFSILHVSKAQMLLNQAGITSAVTGDVGLSYHGVDIAIHTVELCVPTASQKYVVKALAAEAADYEALADLLQPDFYHPYKKGAARFLMRSVNPPLELHIVNDSALGLDLTSPDIVTTGLSQATVHQELRDLCQDVDDAILSAIKWLCLGPFLNGWLSLANKFRGSETELIFLMEAERLIDANNVDAGWFETYLDDAESCKAAKQLLAGKQRRQLGSKWD